MNDDALPDSWQIIRRWLPEDLDFSARQHGFFRRARGLQNADTWLRLILMHVAGGLSLEQTVVRARELGLADVSGVALFKRLRCAEKWLLALTHHLMRERRESPERFQWAEELPRLRVIDATDIQEPGETGSAWRLHYSLRLPELCCDHFEVTDEHGGEKLGRFRFAEGEWILADRGYSHRAGAALVVDSGAHLILRWNPPVLPLETSNGELFRPLQAFGKMKIGEVRQEQVWMVWNQKRYRLWVCAIRKGRVAAARARKKVLDKARSNQTRHPRGESLACSRYTFVVTSLSPRTLPPSAALELYRCRWQIELEFKRLKSLLAAGHVPKRDDASAKGWMQAKIFTALLIERLEWESKLFFPWGYSLN